MTLSTSIIKARKLPNRISSKSSLHDDDRKIISETSEKLMIWKDLMIPERRLYLTNISMILKKVHAISKQQDGKAVGPDHICSKVWKVFVEENGIDLKKIMNAINKIYCSGKIPDDS